MKTIMSLAAVAGVALALSFTAASAQQSPAQAGTGAATQQNKPSTAGMSNPGGMPSNATMGGGMMGKKMKHHRRHHHRKKMM